MVESGSRLSSGSRPTEAWQAELRDYHRELGSHNSKLAGSLAPCQKRSISSCVAGFSKL